MLIKNLDDSENLDPKIGLEQKQNNEALLITKLKTEEDMSLAFEISV